MDNRESTEIGAKALQYVYGHDLTPFAISIAWEAARVEVDQIPAEVERILEQNEKYLKSKVPPEGVTHITELATIIEKAAKEQVATILSQLICRSNEMKQTLLEINMRINTLSEEDAIRQYSKLMKNLFTEHAKELFVNCLQRHLEKIEVEFENGERTYIQLSKELFDCPKKEKLINITVQLEPYLRASNGKITRVIVS